MLCFAGLLGSHPKYSCITQQKVDSQLDLQIAEEEMQATSWRKDNYDDAFARLCLKVQKLYSIEGDQALHTLLVKQFSCSVSDVGELMRCRYSSKHNKANTHRFTASMQLALRHKGIGTVNGTKKKFKKIPKMSYYPGGGGMQPFKDSKAEDEGEQDDTGSRKKCNAKADSQRASGASKGRRTRKRSLPVVGDVIVSPEQETVRRASNVKRARRRSKAKVKGQSASGASKVIHSEKQEMPADGDVTRPSNIKRARRRSKAKLKGQSASGASKVMQTAKRDVSAKVPPMKATRLRLRTTTHSRRRQRQKK